MSKTYFDDNKEIIDPTIHKFLYALMKYICYGKSQTKQGTRVKLQRFVEDIKTKNQVVGLSRLIAGFSWEWKSKNNPEEYDIRIDGVHLRWNSNTDNWIESSRSVEEVGCIYTIQGEDLNYVGVIIGEELLYRDGKLVYNPDGYKDKGAKRRSMSQVIDNHTLTNEQMLQQILNVYKVLLSRSIKGTYVYVCDPQLREYLSQFFQVID